MPELFEFCVQGTPKSVQAAARSKNRWKAQVSAAAQAEWPNGQTLINFPVEVEVTYFYDGDALDVDNMLKPILDAMIGIVLVDDNIVTDVNGRKRDINGAYQIRNMSPVLAAAFCKGTEFVRIRIFDAPNHQDLNT